MSQFHSKIGFQFQTVEILQVLSIVHTSAFLKGCNFGLEGQH